VFIEAYGISEITWTIFSRWGEKIFEGQSADAYWDGTFRGKSMDPGVFIIHMRFSDLATGKPGEHISTVTLVR
ncbi:MAG TPA: gliding motility-associated C-terminal domain-containing protein, partial [Saprospiraceae bacterium]